MRGFVVYESLFGNTARIAQAVVDGMKKHLDVELHSVAEGLQPEGVDLLVMGGPTHAFSMSRMTTREDAVNQGAEADPTIGLREWLDDLPQGNHTPFAAFDTRVDMVRRLPGSLVWTRPTPFLWRLHRASIARDVEHRLTRGDVHHNSSSTWGGWN